MKKVLHGSKTWIDLIFPNDDSEFKKWIVENNYYYKWENHC